MAGYHCAKFQSEFIFLESSQKTQRFFEKKQKGKGNKLVFRSSCALLHFDDYIQSIVGSGGIIPPSREVRLKPFLFLTIEEALLIIYIRVCKSIKVYLDKGLKKLYVE